MLIDLMSEVLLKGARISMNYCAAGEAIIRIGGEDRYRN
jgi:hypothetical protein